MPPNTLDEQMKALSDPTRREILHLVAEREIAASEVATAFDLTRAAVILAELCSAFRVAGMHADRPHVQLKAWHWLFFNEANPCRINVAVLLINPKTGATEYCTAGAIGVLIIDAKPFAIQSPGGIVRRT